MTEPRRCIVMGLGLWCAVAGVSVHAQGIVESYRIRSAASERIMQLRAAVLPLVESQGDGPARCTLAASSAADSPPITISAIDDGCRLATSLGADHRVWVETHRVGDSWQTSCGGDVPANWLPRNCIAAGVTAPNEELVRGAESDAALATAWVTGDTARLFAIRQQGLSNLSGRSGDHELAVLVVSATQLMVRHELAEGDETAARKLIAETAAAVAGKATAIFHDGSVLEHVGNDALRCDWIAEAAGILPQDERDVITKRAQTCKVCKSGSETERKALIERSLGTVTDVDLALVGRLSELVGFNCLGLDDPHIDAFAAKLPLDKGDADDYSEARAARNSLEFLRAERWLQQSRDPKHLPPALEAAFVRAFASGNVPLLEWSVHGSLFEGEFGDHRALYALGRAWAIFVLTRPVPIEGTDMGSLVQARAFDLFAWGVTAVRAAPPFAEGIADELGEALEVKGDPSGLSAGAGDLLKLMSYSVSGQTGKVREQLQRFRQTLDTLDPKLVAQYGLDAYRPAIDRFIDVADAASRGQVRTVLKSWSQMLRDCDRGVVMLFGDAKDASTCESARLSLAAAAIDFGDLDTAQQFLALVPKAGDTQTIRTNTTLYLDLVARMALAEGDDKTARAAYERAQGMDKGAVSTDVDHALFGLRLDLATHADDAARAKREIVRGAVLSLGQSERRLVQGELAVAAWLLDPSATADHEMQATQEGDIRFLGEALTRSDAQQVKAVLNMRAGNRDRFLTAAVAHDKAGAESAWREGAWFKGIEGEVAASVGGKLALSHPGLKQTMGAIGKATAVVDYLAYQQIDLRTLRPGQRRLAATVLTGTALTLVDLGDLDTLAQQIDTLRKSIQALDEAGTRAASATIAARLIDPLRSAVGAAQKVWLIPDGAIHLLPFDVVNTAEHGFGPKVEVRIAGSYRQVLATSPETKTGSVAVIAGPDFGAAPSADSIAKGAPTLDRMVFDPLPGARAEGDDLRKLFGTAPTFTLLAETGATEPAVRALRNVRYLSFATHGYALAQAADRGAAATRGVKIVASANAPAAHDAPGANPPSPTAGLIGRLLERYDDPLEQVGLALAGANERSGKPTERDGLLTGHEIAQWDLHGTELAVLSACNSGIGEALDGSAVGSLANAFHDAGVRSVVYTLWPIADEPSRMLMHSFYRRLQTTGEVRASLDAAKQELRNSSSFSAPYYWAAFQLSGP